VKLITLKQTFPVGEENLGEEGKEKGENFSRDNIW